MRPPEVLDRRVALIDFLEGASYRRYVSTSTSLLWRSASRDQVKGDGGPPEDRDAAGSALCDEMLRVARIGEAFFVDRAMVPVIQQAALDLDEDDYLARENLPAEAGFLVFDEPLVIPVGMPGSDYQGENTVRAIMWRPGAGGAHTDDPDNVYPGVHLYFFTDRYYRPSTITDRTPSEVDVSSAARVLGSLYLWDLDFFPFGFPVGEVAESIAAQTQIVDGMSEALGSEAAFMNGNVVEAERMKHMPDPSRLIVALFRLLGQTIVTTEEVKIDRSMTRRMARKNIPARVQTIKLRRLQRATEPDQVGEHPVEWQHSWIVRGHWAWRDCGPQHPQAEPRPDGSGWRTRLYIAPHLKGPEDKPLLVTEKVWGLSR